jgi:hypothetical protein
MQLFAQLADEPPEFLVHKWKEYQWDVLQLGKGGLSEVDSLVARILDSADTPIPIRAVLLQGHADYDLRRQGKAREDFESDISKKRAEAVFKYIKESFDKRSLTPEQDAVLAQMAWKKEWFGSTERIYKPARNEEERSKNRRVEIFVAHSADPIRFGGKMFCPHGGEVQRAFRMGLPRISNGWIITGCPFVSPFGLGFSPCMTVTWITSPVESEEPDIIDADSMGLCFSPQMSFQGNVLILPSP